MTLPLFERYPGTAALPLAGIAELPTPLERLSIKGVDAVVGGLWVKRDDLTNPVYGGNKVRKLDFLLGKALAEERPAVITFGAYGSNHALATAVHARALGIEPHIVLSPQAPTAYAAATVLAHAGLGTHLHLVEGWEGLREAVRVRQELTARDGIEPLVIPMGGTNALGATGYVNAALEVGERFGSVYVAAGTLGTAVGLAIGFAAARAATRVIAVRVTPAQIANEEVARSLAGETIALLCSLDPSFPDLRFEDLHFELRDEFYEPGYAVPTAETEAAVAVAGEAGLPLETTYTGKAMQAFRSDARRGALPEGEVLFWDTYHSGPKPAPGPVDALPDRLQEYVAECDSLFGAVTTVHETEGGAG
ncbi:MAG: pyridoxal-phosphate dependent enzyme [Anaerosomatales bacterium]|nr:pyridoxal-phosphate dependent enzyme [Anaerosomatales bacterium]MDT8435063.1 pyridoxal-phosphate dependent enzyme [Anaerosomatales bacterium]